MPDGPVTRCGSCASPELEPVLDLGMQPLPQARPGADDGQRYPLRLVRCPRCTLVQLDYIVPQAELFPADYPYATGNTKALRDHFAGLALEISGHAGWNDLIADIGGNDGTMLRALRDADPGYRLLLIEPADQARKAAAAGIDTVQEYFTAELARKIRQEHGPAAVITASSTFGHIPDPHDFLDGVTALLAEDGTFIIENQDWQGVVNSLQIDTVYHEHLRYYTPASLSYLLARHHLLVTSLERLAMHGGSFRATAVREQDRLQARAAGIRDRLHAIVRQAAAEGPVYAVGAPTRATPLVNYADIGGYLACACEIAGSEKIGARIPGTGVPVVDEEQLFAGQPPHALLLAWDLADYLVPLLRRRGYQGRIILPLPEPRFADD
jgi:C-methyltransferase C-terminal domain/Putative zinc binding domain/Methyltransferase domain